MALFDKLDSRPLLGARSPSFSTVGGAATILAVLAAVFLVWPIWRAGFVTEINRNEPWNAWFIDAARYGAKLYPGANELVVNNYPPLSFYITGAAAYLTGDTIFAGRLLSLFSVGGMSLAAAYCIRFLGGSPAAAAFGGFWLLATFAHSYTRHVGANDPSLLGLAAMLWGFAVFLGRWRSGRSPAPGIALMVFAGFIKHSAPALPIAALIWLAFQDRRAAFRMAILGIALCIAGFVLCQVLFGPDFARNMLLPREVSLKHMAALLNKLQWVAPAALVGGIWAWQEWSRPEAKLIALALGLSAASGLLQAAGAGVVYNAFYELSISAAIAIGLALEGVARGTLARRHGASAVQVAIVALLTVRLLASQQLEHYFVFTSPSFREEIRQAAAATKLEIEKIKEMPGAIDCSNMTVCYRAGKAFVYDGYWVDQLLTTGARRKDEVEQARSALDIHTVPYNPQGMPNKQRLF
jgi:hypothetical protein